MSEQLRSGQITLDEFHDAEASMHRSHGPLHDHGHGLHDGLHGRGARRRHAGQRRDPGGRCAPQPARARGGPAHRRDGASRTCVLSQILTREAFENAIRVNGGIGGSTNAVVHLIAMARRVGVELEPRRLGPARARGALPRRPDAVGPLPDGGFLRGRRPAGGDPRARASTACCTRTRSPSTAARSGRTTRTRRAGTAR